MWKVSKKVALFYKTETEQVYDKSVLTHLLRGGEVE